MKKYVWIGMIAIGVLAVGTTAGVIWQGQKSVDFSSRNTDGESGEVSTVSKRDLTDATIELIETSEEETSVEPSMAETDEVTAPDETTSTNETTVTKETTRKKQTDTTAKKTAETTVKKVAETTAKKVAETTAETQKKSDEVSPFVGIGKEVSFVSPIETSYKTVGDAVIENEDGSIRLIHGWINVVAPGHCIACDIGYYNLEYSIWVDVYYPEDSPKYSELANEIFGSDYCQEGLNNPDNFDFIWTVYKGKKYITSSQFIGWGGWDGYYIFTKTSSGDAVFLSNQK